MPNNSKNYTSNIPQLAHEYSKEEVAILSTISVAIITTSLVLNILVLLGYLCSRSTREKPSSILLVSMAFCQLATASVVIPYQLVFQVIKPELAANGGASCIALGSITYSPYVVSSETVLLMTVDRYLAVCLMTKYRLIMTRKRILAAVLFTWIHALIFGTVAVPFGYTVQYNHRVGACAIDFENRLLEGVMMALPYGVIPFLIIVVLSYRTVKQLRTHNQRLAANSEDVRAPNNRNHGDRTREG